MRPIVVSIDTAPKNKNIGVYYLARALYITMSNNQSLEETTGDQQQKPKKLRKSDDG